MKIPSKPFPHIYIVIDLGAPWTQNVLNGILRWERQFGPWQLFILDKSLLAPESILPDRYDGIITDTVFQWPMQETPVVLIDCWEEKISLQNYARVLNDGEAIGKMGAEHLLERKLKHFAFISHPDNAYWCQQRRHGFVKRLAAEGFSCEHYMLPLPEQNTPAAQTQLLEWLRSLPPSTGILGTNDACAHHILNLCLFLKIRSHDFGSR